ncbi:MAG: 4-phosphoerythronate dehydrogenase [Bacteroidaceae bacterium]|nr:4-phosphoerythronate dehydrogenase [Bacteroidaceae bacterium]
MKVVVDDKIPYLLTPLRGIVEVTALPAEAITAEAVRDADALIVRTRTRCDASLLGDSRVRFIATATIGYDHIDTAWCASHDICWTNAPGCNASSVCQYVECALRLLASEGVIAISSSTTIGIVGVGHVGSLVKAMSERLGLRTLCYDPPLAAESSFPNLQSSIFNFQSSLSDLQSCDILTFHVPLTKDGPYPTWHMADEALFASLRRKPLLVNTSRGAVVDTAALKAALREGRIRQAVIDVWEGEPDIDLDLLRMTRITTPHIAGYSADGKARASQMVLDALTTHFGLPSVEAETPPPSSTPYDIDADSLRLKASPSTFEYQRNHYPLRRETISAD